MLRYGLAPWKSGQGMWYQLPPMYHPLLGCGFSSGDLYYARALCKRQYTRAGGSVECVPASSLAICSDFLYAMEKISTLETAIACRPAQVCSWLRCVHDVNICRIICILPEYTRAGSTGEAAPARPCMACGRADFSVGGCACV